MGKFSLCISFAAVAAVVGRVISEVDDYGVHMAVNNVIVTFAGVCV